LQCLLWRCVLVLSALRAVLQAVVQSAVLRSCASRPCALQHSRGSSAAPSNLLFPGASAAPLHAHLCAGMCAEPYTHVQRFPCTHTCAFTHTCNRNLAQPCVRTPSMYTQKCDQTKGLVHSPVFMHAHICMHPIHLHNHVHDDTSAAPALHTAMCMRTHAKLSPASTVHTAKRNARSDVQHCLCTPPYARIPALTARGQIAAGTAHPPRRRWAMSGGKAPP